VDPATMGVHGLEGIHVADASVMPFVTNGNIYAPVVMLAEKTADLLRGRTPLPAQHTAFYKAGKDMPLSPGDKKILPV
ncbi:MAG: GMC oxidoreductase, partial [Rhodococcus sp. (in: high G+C Gram-positive bacteria)]